MDKLMTLRARAQIVVAGIVVVSTVASIADSYLGLLGWAIGHGYSGLSAYLFPGFIDAFPLAGEITLFVAMVDHWDWKARVYPWIAIVSGLVVSVAANVGHVRTTDVLTQGTQGLPPVAAWMSLVVGLGLLKRIMANRPKAEPVADAEPLADWELELLEEPADEPHDELDNELEDLLDKSGPDLEKAAATFADDLKAGRVPGLNRIRATCHVGHTNAPIIQRHLRELAGSRS
jgi:hypothetical protein